ncbi:uncharacterized protein N7515_004035 [Penicillium bovifimosum]|uniref:Uncharacterized protein n=1 Tax=Penicillium bovifimosum TaxID=126998 RepID=A0A9W9H5R8_9EURO|nr:uncharacterized protein N7515_004035 [Penicillium bovifimosum]KAJ5139187.1 hypothetical protein N7515_004035 [Penicillium bovifimosum]
MDGPALCRNNMRSIDDAASGDEASEDEASEDEASEDEASEDEASEDEASEDEASEDEASEDEASEDEASEDEASSSEGTKIRNMMGDEPVCVGEERRRIGREPHDPGRPDVDSHQKAEMAFGFLSLSDKSEEMDVAFDVFRGSDGKGTMLRAFGRRE